jgi:hypothetical protein
MFLKWGDDASNANATLAIEGINQSIKRMDRMFLASFGRRNEKVLARGGAARARWILFVCTICTCYKFPGNATLEITSQKIKMQDW